MYFWTVILTAVLGGVIIYLYQTLTYFKRCGIPHETPLPILGNTASLFTSRKCHFTLFLSNYSKKWPDAKYFGFYMFQKPLIIINNVELIKSITVKNFNSFHDHDSFVTEDSDPLFGKGLFSLKGNKWKETRSVLSPAFTANKMKEMFKLMTDCAYNFTQFMLENTDQDNNEFEMKDAFSKYATDVIATCAFGISVDSLKNPHNKFYVLGKRSMKFTYFQNLKIFIMKLMPYLTKFIKLKIFDSELTDFFFNSVKDTLERRKEEGIFRPDMLQLMMDSQEKNTNLKMDVVDMTSQAFLFFLAGFETSASLMSYAAVELARNQDMQKRLIMEIDEVIQKTDGNPNYEVINSMQYLEAILYETLRFHPISGFMDRQCVEDFELPPALPNLKPYTMKPGDILWIPSYKIHTDPNNYDDPDVFNPDRFMNQKMSTNMPTFLAFGIGPRSCIGNRFALLENKLVLFYLLSKCTLEVSPKLKQPITYSIQDLIPLIKDGFWLKIVPR